MKKEKTVRSYKRKTKSGKVVTVKQHTAKYDAAEEMKKALAKKGAGEELASKKLTADELKQVKDIVSENSELDEQYVAAFYPELSPRMVKAVMAEYKKKSATPQAKAANTAGKTPKPKAEKSSAPELGFTKDEYKAWYHWDTENDPKNAAALKVKKALLGAMGPRAYKKYEEDMTNSYSNRGHSKAFGTLPELVSARKEAYNSRLMEKTHKAQKALAESMGAKDAAESFDKRAKEQGAKKKEATAKIKELSPKKGEIAKAQQKALNFDKKFKRDSPETTLSKEELSSLRSDYGFSGIKKTADGKYSYVENDTGEKKVATVKQIRKMIAPFENAKGLSVMSASEYKQRSKKDPAVAFQKFIAANDRNVEAMYRAQEKYGKKSEQYAKAKEKYEETRRVWKESPEYKAVKATGESGLPSTPRTRMESQRTIGSRKSKAVKQELDDFIVSSKYKGTLRAIQGYGQNEIAGRLIAKGASSKEAQSVAKKVSSLYSRYKKYAGMGYPRRK